MKWLERLTSSPTAAKSCWAIDIGSSGVRAVLLKRRGRAARVADWREASWLRESPEPPSPEQVGRGLAEITARRRISAEMIVSSLPIHQVFIKALTVPFARTSQIRQVIAAEAELHIPYPLEEIVLDFWPLEVLEGGKTRVMTVAVRKEVLAAHLELLAGAGISPSAVGIDFLGLASALNHTGLIDPSGEILLAEVGARHTACAFFREGRLSFLRGFAWGTDSVCRELMKAGGVGFAEADRLRAEAVSGASEDWVRAAIEPAREELAAELTRTVYAASGRSSGTLPSRLLLSGEGIPGLKEFLAGRLGIEVAVPPPIKATKVVKSRRELPRAAWTALGLALNRLRPSEQDVNFRKGEFSPPTTALTIRRRLWLAAAQAAAVVAVVLVFLLGRISAEENRARELQERVRDILAQTATPPDQIPAGLELYHLEEKLKQAERRVNIYRRLDTLSSLDILKEMSRSIPAEIPVQIVELDIGPDRVRFKGRTNSYGAAEAVRRALAESPYFSNDIDPGRMRTRRRGGELVTVEFNYLIPVKSPGT